MSDVQIPVYVARSQVASAIDLIVQVARFTADGSRRLTRITQAAGLDGNNQYQTRDLFVSKLQGTQDGQLVADLAPTGQRPTFCHEPYEQGLGQSIHRTEGLWEP
jgi:pilus assembly protein CpaF